MSRERLAEACHVIRSASRRMYGHPGGYEVYKEIRLVEQFLDSCEPILQREDVVVTIESIAAELRQFRSMAIMKFGETSVPQLRAERLLLQMDELKRGLIEAWGWDDP